MPIPSEAMVRALTLLHFANRIGIKVHPATFHTKTLRALQARNFVRLATTAITHPCVVRCVPLSILHKWQDHHTMSPTALSNRPLDIGYFYITGGSA